MVPDDPMVARVVECQSSGCNGGFSVGCNIQRLNYKCNRSVKRIRRKAIKVLVTFDLSGLTKFSSTSYCRENFFWIRIPYLRVKNSNIYATNAKAARPELNSNRFSRVCKVCVISQSGGHCIPSFTAMRRV